METENSRGKHRGGGLRGGEAFKDTHSTLTEFTVLKGYLHIFLLVVSFPPLNIVTFFSLLINKDFFFLMPENNIHE